MCFSENSQDHNHNTTPAIVRLTPVEDSNLDEPHPLSLDNEVVSSVKVDQATEARRPRYTSSFAAVRHLLRYRSSSPLVVDVPIAQICQTITHMVEIYSPLRDKEIGSSGRQQMSSSTAAESNNFDSNSDSNSATMSRVSEEPTVKGVRGRLLDGEKLSCVDENDDGLVPHSSMAILIIIFINEANYATFSIRYEVVLRRLCEELSLVRVASLDKFDAVLARFTNRVKGVIIADDEVLYPKHIALTRRLASLAKESEVRRSIVMAFDFPILVAALDRLGVFRLWMQRFFGRGFRNWRIKGITNDRMLAHLVETNNMVSCSMRHLSWWWATRFIIVRGTRSQDQIIKLMPNAKYTQPSPMRVELCILNEKGEGSSPLAPSRIPRSPPALKSQLQQLQLGQKRRHPFEHLFDDEEKVGANMESFMNQVDRLSPEKICQHDTAIVLHQLYDWFVPNPNEANSNEWTAIGDTYFKKAGRVGFIGLTIDSVEVAHLILAFCRVDPPDVDEIVRDSESDLNLDSLDDEDLEDLYYTTTAHHSQAAVSTTAAATSEKFDNVNNNNNKQEINNNNGKNGAMATTNMVLRNRHDLETGNLKSSDKDEDPQPTKEELNKIGIGVIDFAYHGNAKGMKG